MPKAIFYYQTFYTQNNDFISIQPILYKNTPITHIHLSAIHFGYDNDSTPYIHLNNRLPSDPYFDKVWNDLKLAKQHGIKIIAMIGGAGGGYESLFSNFDVFYKILQTFLKTNRIIDGIDLDIEETCDINNIKCLINNIVNDFGEKYIITTAPVDSSLLYNVPGMGGFCYKDLINSKEGTYIDYINCQAYDSFTKDTLDNIVKNGYSSDKIVMGLISGEAYRDEFKKMVLNYKQDFGGIFVWEYYNTLPSPLKWTQYIQSIYDLH